METRAEIVEEALAACELLVGASVIGTKSLLFCQARNKSVRLVQFADGSQLKLCISPSLVAQRRWELVRYVALLGAAEMSQVRLHGGEPVLAVEGADPFQPAGQDPGVGFQPPDRGLAIVNLGRKNRVR